MTVDPVQAVSGTLQTGDAATIVQAFGSANAAGHLLTAGFTFDSTSGKTVSSVTDTQGNTWQLAKLQNDTTNRQAAALYYAENSKAGANTVTVTFSSATDFRCLNVAEWPTGVTAASLTGTPAGATAAGTTAANNLSSGNTTPGVDNALIIGLLDLDDGQAATVTAGTGFTKDVQDTATGVSLALEHVQQGTAAAIAATWTQSVSGRYNAIAAAFKTAPTGRTATATGARTGVGTGKTKAAAAATLAAIGTAATILAATGAAHSAGIAQPHATAAGVHVVTGSSGASVAATGQRATAGSGSPRVAAVGASTAIGSATAAGAATATGTSTATGSAHSRVAATGTSTAAGTAVVGRTANATGARVTVGIARPHVAAAAVSQTAGSISVQVAAVGNRFATGTASVGNTVTALGSRHSAENAATVVHSRGVRSAAGLGIVRSAVAVDVPDARAHADAVLLALRAGLPATISVYEGQGPVQPDQHVPYVVAYIDLGLPGGYPFCPGRDLSLTVSLRGVGKTSEQAQRAGMKGRAAMLSGTVIVAGRHLKVYQDNEIPRYPERDDTISPPLFGQLLVFDVVSDPA